MNTIKLYRHLIDGMILKVSGNISYHITSNCIYYNHTNTEGLEEVPFDTEVQALVDNALSKVNSLVKNAEVVSLIQAIVLEKMEDFD